MEASALIVAFRKRLLDYRSEHHGSTRLPEGASIVGAESAASYPCVQIKPSGGDGAATAGLYHCDLEVSVWARSDQGGDWATLFHLLGEVSKACHRKTFAEMPAPILRSMETGVPSQAGVGNLMGLRVTYHIIARETP